jgi:hypothetical protein
MKKIALLIVFLSAGTARADDAQPYSYEDLGKIINALCQKAAYGYRAEIDSACPQIGKRLEPQISAEKKAAEKKDDKQ